VMRTRSLSSKRTSGGPAAVPRGVGYMRVWVLGWKGDGLIHYLLQLVDFSEDVTTARRRISVCNRWSYHKAEVVRDEPRMTRRKRTYWEATVAIVSAYISISPSTLGEGGLLHRPEPVQ